MRIRQIHHVAYRCNDTKETVDFYERVLGMRFLLAISEERVPSTKEPDPYMHVFLDAGNGNILAFFELPNAPPMGRDPNTPAWVQHIAFELVDERALSEAAEELTALGIDTVGPTDHSIIKSIYFFDPNGHRLELTVRTARETTLAELNALAPEMLAAWNNSKKPVKHAAWLHAREFARET
jgi:catechol 2,3-dioxygenase-like lactoylglutathione lyase family enzyme